MFLLYRNHGERRFGRVPVRPYPRGAWEFQFIMEGTCLFLVRFRNQTRSERVVGPALVLSGPECVHGWDGRPHDRCTSMVFHFDEADFTLRSIIGLDGYRILRFAPTEIPVIQALYDRCAEARRSIGMTPPEAKKRAGFFEPLIYRIVSTELTVFVLRHIEKSEWGPAPKFGESKVNEALAWYEANLSSNPTIADVAKAVHFSPTHLRRLFHKARGMSPQSAFTQVQFERVKWLMRDPGMTLEQISQSTGFGSASAFSRAFKAKFGLPPKAFRETLAQGEARSAAGSPG